MPPFDALAGQNPGTATVQVDKQRCSLPAHMPCGREHTERGGGGQCVGLAGPGRGGLGHSRWHSSLCHRGLPALHVPRLHGLICSSMPCDVFRSNYASWHHVPDHATPWVLQMSRSMS